jgi:alkylation response protein AidB-like acyl-CoA dehydrogenase
VPASLVRATPGPRTEIEERAMNRSMFEDEHDEFRASVRTFISREVSPSYLEWEDEGIAPRDLFTAAGRGGFLGIAVPAEHGGGAVSDFRFNAVLAEELAAAGIGGAGLGITLHNDITTPYFIEYCTPEQGGRWLPGIATGELITAIAMTEPGMGSDLAGLATSAVRDGDVYVVNGSKTFITNGINADLVITAVRTDPGSRHGGVTLLVLERGMDGFTRGRNLDKIGMHSQDTAELFFDDVRVPIANRLGEEGQGFRYLTANLAQERLSIAVTGVASARAALGWTLDYVKERTAFGQPIGSFQNTKFVLAEIKTEVEIAQAYVDQAVLALNAKTLSPADAASAKWWCTELQKRTVDRCLQLFGGYGYMREYPIARAYTDARITTIYGGTTEIMKGIIARDLGL